MPDRHAAVIERFNDSTTCTWCEKTGETVTITFTSGFLQDAALCWKCLQKAVRVNHKQTAGPAVRPASREAS